MRGAAAACLAALLPAALPAEEIGRIGVDWVGNDIIVEAIEDPKVEGVTCHLTYFERSLWDRFSQGNFFEDPSNSAIECVQTGPIVLGDISRSAGGESVFRERQSPILKAIRVTRIWDRENSVLVYVAHARELSEGSAKMAVSTIPLGPEVVAAD